MTELSIVIPTYNRVERLRVCLEALSRQTQTESEFEVIVVVDGSTDKTVEMLERFESPYLLRSIWQENTGQAAALNRGIQEARGRYILFLDDDIVADPRLVAEHLQTHLKHPKAVVVGQITLSLPPNAEWYAQAFARGWRVHYDRLNREMTKITWEDCYSGNMSAPRDALLASGGFDLEIMRGFDIELARVLEEQGCYLIYRPGALGCQKEEKGFRELSRDAENIARADVMLYRRDPRRLTETLASFTQGTWRKLFLRRLLLVCRVPLAWLEFFGRFVRNPDHKHLWHSLIQTVSYWKGVKKSAEKALWRELTHGIPILMYHAIGTSREDSGPYVMPLNRFVSQMTWLKKMGYRPISLEQFMSCRRDHRPVPSGSVVITFDDGYEDNYAHAFPVLQEKEIPITIFLVSSYIGRKNGWDQQTQLAGRPLMAWPQIEEMMGQGVQFGAHTCTHPQLTMISSDQAEEEIVLSGKQLEERLGVPVALFAYPYGEHDRCIRAIVKRAGFAAALTADAGLNTMVTPVLSLRRTEIYGTDSLPRFLLSLWTGDAEAFGWRRSRKP